MNIKDMARMLHWLIISAALYGAALLVNQPQLQIVLWKTGHITVAAFVGYWIDRGVFKESRIYRHSDPLVQIRRALIICAAMLAVSMGL